MSEPFRSSDMNISTDHGPCDEVVILKVLDKFAQDNSLDPVTSIQLWKHYFQLRSGVFKGFETGMRNVFYEMDKIFQTINKDRENSTRISFIHLDALYKDMRKLDKNIYDDAERDRKLLLDLEKALADYKDIDKDDIILRNNEKKLTHARKELFDQAKEAKRKMKKYHKTAFKLEKAEIKKEIAEKEEEIRRHTEKFELLQKKVEKKLAKYQEEDAKLDNLITNVQQKSNECTQAKVRIDTKRADFIRQNLEKYVNEVETRNDDLERASTYFGYINVHDIVPRREPTEKLLIKRVQKYVGTKNKHELIEQVKREMEEEKKRRQSGDREDDTSDDDDDDEVKAPNLRARSRRRMAKNETPVVPFKSAVNGDEAIPKAGPSGVQDGSSAEPDDGGSPRVKRIGSKYLVTAAYKKKAANEMNLSRGKIVKVIMPANNKGMAFGEKKGRFGRKTKGYFPMECVVPAD